MKTYQDLVAVGENEKARMDVVVAAISEHQNSEAYKVAKIAEEYYAKRNVTMTRYQKMVYNVLGQAVPDLFSANYKLTHGFFRRFVIQQAQYVLSNGVTFEKEDTAKRLGADFDTDLQKLAKKALVAGVSFGFWNYDHLEVFGFADTTKEPGFVPLYDEDSGLLRAGIRYWNTNDSTRRMTLYEEDGITDYIKRKDENVKVKQEKRAYIVTTKRTESGGVEEEVGTNYPGFPIIPMYANDVRESEIVGLRESIDCYDFIKSGMANNVDEAAAFYWTLKNTGGMDDMDLQRFVERMKILKAQVLDDGVEAEAHTMSVPVEANEKLLDRLRRDLYEDAMLVDVERATTGDITATGIRFIYQPQDDKCGDFEYCIRDFISALFKLTGIEDSPSFRWNRIANQTEEVQMIMTEVPVIGEDAALDLLPNITPEMADKIRKNLAAEDTTRFNEPAEEPVEE